MESAASFDGAHPEIQRTQILLTSCPRRSARWLRMIPTSGAHMSVSHRLSAGERGVTGFWARMAAPLVESPAWLTFMAHTPAQRAEQKR
jgi:hypothetical protein